MNAAQDEHGSRDESPAADAAPAGSDAPRRGQVVLLVEDSEADREFYGRLLWYNGFDVIHAADGDAALARAVESTPDLILLDIMLPGAMNGLDVARRLRERGDRTPIVVLSGGPRDQLEAEARAAGVQSYLQKPIDPFAVVREVARHIGYARGGGGAGAAEEGT